MAFIIAAFNLLVQRNGFQSDATGMVHLSIAEFSLYQAPLVQSFLLAIPDLSREMIAEARELLQLQKHTGDRLRRRRLTKTPELANPDRVRPIIFDFAQATLSKCVDLQSIERDDGIGILA